MQRQGNMMKPWNGTPNQSMVSCGWLARWLPGLCVSSRTPWSLLRAPLLVFLPGSSESELQQQQRRRSGGGAPASERLQVRSFAQGQGMGAPKGAGCWAWKSVFIFRFRGGRGTETRSHTARRHWRRRRGSGRAGSSAGHHHRARSSVWLYTLCSGRAAGEHERARAFLSASLSSRLLILDTTFQFLADFESSFLKNLKVRCLSKSNLQNQP